MTRITDTTRRFRVHARHIDGHHARLVDETSFEAAAVAYLEDFASQEPGSDDHEISIIVHEVGTGREHCFKIDLDSGAAVPCG
jgi:hypothetical protein